MWRRSFRTTPDTAITTRTTTTAADPPAPGLSRDGLPRAPRIRASLEDDSRPILYAGAIALGVALALAVTFLSFYLDQAPHRIAKMLLAGAVLVVFLSYPRLSPFALLLALPFVSWLPKSPIPFLNATNAIVGFSLGSVLFVRASARFEQMRLPRVWTALLVLMGIFLFAFIRGWVMPPPGYEYPVAFRAKQLWVALAGILAFPPFFQFLDRRPTIRASLVVLSIAMALGAAGCIWEGRGARIGYRVLGGIGDVNRLGAFFAVGLCFLLPVVLRKGALRGGWRFLTILGTAVSLLGLVLPNSRGALIAFAAAGTIYFMFMRPKALVPFVVAMTLGWFALPTVVQERLTTTYAGVVESGAEYDVMNKESGRRLEIWKATIGVIGENAIVGVGYANLPIRLNEELDWYRNSHNAYLQIWGETGLAGLFVFVGLLVWLVRVGWRLSRRRDDPLACAVGEGVFAMALCLAIANLFGDRFLHFSLEGLFVFAAAVGARLSAGTAGDGGPE